MKTATGMHFGGWNRYNLNRLLALAVAGLAVTAAVVVGTNDVRILGGSDSSTLAPSRVVLPPAFEEPALGTYGFNEAQKRVMSPAGAFEEPALGTLGFNESQRARMNGTNELAVQPVADPHFGTPAESITAIEGVEDFGPARAAQLNGVVDPYFGTGVESITAIEGVEDLGSPALGVVYPSEYPPEGAIEVDYGLPTTFGTDPIYPTEGPIDPYFHTGPESISVIEGIN